MAQSERLCVQTFGLYYIYIYKAFSKIQEDKKICHRGKKRLKEELNQEYFLHEIKKRIGSETLSTGMKIHKVTDRSIDQLVVLTDLGQEYSLQNKRTSNGHRVNDLHPDSPTTQRRVRITLYRREKQKMEETLGGRIQK